MDKRIMKIKKDIKRNYIKTTQQVISNLDSTKHELFGNFDGNDRRKNKKNARDIN